MNILTNINKRLRLLEQNRDIKERRKADPLYDIFDNWKNVQIWNVTVKEFKLISELGDITKDYNLDTNTPSGSVLMFARNFYKSIKKGRMVKPYRFMRFENGALSGYIQSSRFWNKERTNYVTKGGTRMVDIAYHNDERKMVIFRYKGDYLITTKSSYKNFIRAYAGKKPKNPVLGSDDNDVDAVIERLNQL